MDRSTYVSRGLLHSSLGNSTGTLATDHGSLVLPVGFTRRLLALPRRGSAFETRLIAAHAILHAVVCWWCDGGFIVAVLCPLFLTTYFELPLSLAIVTGMAFLTFFACRSWKHPDYDWSVASRLKYPAMLLIASPMIAMSLASEG